MDRPIPIAGPRAAARRSTLLALLASLAAAPLPAVVGSVAAGPGVIGLMLAVATPHAAAQEQGNAAVVNGEPITVFRLERHFEDFLKERGRNLGNIRDPRVYKRLKREALFELIDRQLLWEAAQADRLSVPAASLDAALGRVQGAFRSRESYLRRLSAAGFSEPEYRAYLERIMAGEMALARRVDEEMARRFPAGEAEQRTQEFRNLYLRHRADIDPQRALGEDAGARLVAEQVMARERKEAEQRVRTRLREAARVDILLAL